MRRIIFTLIFIITINTIVAQFNLEDDGAIISGKVKVTELDSVIYSQNQNYRLIPASLTKIITTATAIEILGPYYHYKTEFYISGRVEEGVLIGNLVVKSSGDPTLGSKYFETTKPILLFSEISSSLKQNNIKKIAGEIIIESEKIPYSAPRLWEDMGNYYGASPKGFNWMDNTVEVILSSKQVGSVCEVLSTKPQIFPYKLDCRVVAAKHNKDSAYVYGINEVNKWWIEGSIPDNRSRFKIKAAMPDPEITFKEGLMNFLNSEGIVISNNRDINNIDFQDKQHLHTHFSPRLSDIIRIINQKSNNLFADQLLLTLANTKKNVSNWENGHKVVKDFWSNKIEFSNHFRIRDGSGLTPKNLISSNGMVQLLCWMHNNSAHFDVFVKSLAKGGESGTLKSVFKNPQLKGRIVGKSGSMEGVLGYCGYIFDSKLGYVAFCIVANNFLVPTQEIRKLMDEKITQLAL